MPSAAHLGRQNGYGRQKGTPNKVDASIKTMILTALNDVGGVQYLAQQAHANPVAFMGLVGKVLPLQLANADGSNALVVDFRWAGDASPVVEQATVQIEAEATEVKWQDDDTP